MDDLLEIGNWNYLINLAGSEFPIKSQKSLTTYLKSLNGQNLVQSQDFLSDVAWTVKREKWFKELIFDGSDENSEFFDITRWSAYGSAYNFWSYEAIKWMRRDRRVKNFLESEMVKRAYSPDEYVWATLNRNPKCPGGSTDFWPPAADPSSSKEVLWETKPAWVYRNAARIRSLESRPNQPCHGPSYQREICIFGLADLPYLMKSEKYFANKFDAQKDDLILQCLEELISV